MKNNGMILGIGLGLVIAGSYFLLKKNPGKAFQTYVPGMTMEQMFQAIKDAKSSSDLTAIKTAMDQALSDGRITQPQWNDLYSLWYAMGSRV